MFKISKFKVISFVTICIIAINSSMPTSAAPSKQDPCLKNNNGIGNNHEIFIELPTNSQSLGDSDNQILSLRIDPGNSGQIAKFRGYLAEQGFNSAEIDFVVAQLWDAEMKVKQTNLQCSPNEPINKDYTFYAD